MLRGLGGYAEAPRDLRVAQALADESQDFHLPPREPRRIGPSPGDGTARHGARPAGAQLPAYSRSRRRGAEGIENFQRLPLRGFVATAQRQCLLVWTAEAAPGRRRGLPAAPA